MGQIIDEESPYSHSPAHWAVARGDHALLRRILNGLPNLPKAGEVKLEAESLRAEEKAEVLSSVIDRRDVPGKETPLHLAVRLGDATAVDMLMAKGADWSLQNERGWSSLQEAVCTRQDALAMIIIKYYQPLAWAKWCRRLPRIIGSMTRMRDFYMEVTFNFESSVIPFIGRIAPSDTYKIWKRGSNLRADMTLAGFDGFWIQRCDQSFLFLGDGTPDGKLPPGSLCLLNHKEKEVMNALEGAGAPQSEMDIAQEVAAMSKTNVYRPGIDVTGAELVPNLTWRKQEKVEMVGQWKSKVYDMHHVVISVRSRRVPGAMSDAELFGVHEEREEEDEEYDDGGYKDLLTEDEQHQLTNALRVQSGEFDDEGFVEARSSLANGTLAEALAEEDDHEELRRVPSKEKKKWFRFPKKNTTRDTTKKVVPYRGSVNIDERGPADNDPDSKLLRRHSDFIAEEGMSRKGKEKIGRQSSSREAVRSKVPASDDTESEYKKGLRPSLWLTKDFPLKTEELIPLLDVLASKVKAIRRLRELLTTKLPPGTFPVKMAIPVVPTIRVVVTFSKFVELEPEEFHTPLSSPSQFDDEEVPLKGPKAPRESSTTSSSWIPWIRSSQSTGKAVFLEDHLKEEPDPFLIPEDYTWIDLNEKKKRMKDKKSKRKKNKKQQPDASAADTDSNP
ncbi:ankyrin repeat domain-containing protein 13B [Selaginella moellendorffii]|uniref:ankyrin repeat domain-containing protein 13B n=1 Tax=Selaginella moellendorffii TaxID=88036 RepID=UPI000D1CC25D|nr:ankyrin repeat domain-containing protein 13B [Selaginella moellendorffii]|eukprot:XP_024529178.1 ankyrin repeat domain-containing protein 13B [Selaginella moellendorffii]